MEKKTRKAILQVEKFPKISSFFKFNINEQYPYVTFESELEDNSNKINDTTNSSSNDEECSYVPNIFPNDLKNIDLNGSFKVITTKNSKV